MLTKILVFWNAASSGLDVSMKFITSIFLNDIVLNIMICGPPPPPKYQQLLTGAHDVKSSKAAGWWIAIKCLPLIGYESMDFVDVTQDMV